VDEFNLGDISVSFSFLADTEESAAAAAGSMRIRVGDMPVAASPAALGPASPSGSAASGAATTA
jgi:hypothetical protein